MESTTTKHLFNIHQAYVKSNPEGGLNITEDGTAKHYPNYMTGKVSDPENCGVSMVGIYEVLSPEAD